MTDHHQTTTDDQRPGRRRRLLLGGAAVLGAGALLAVPLTAAAQDEGDGWVDEALSGLVEDGTLTQAQVDAVEQALQEARPEGGFGHRGGPFGGRLGGGVALEEAATAIGIEESALRDALRDGQTLAEVAAANDVEAQAVIDALVAAAQERIDAAVAAGRLDAAEATERLEGLTERITEFVNEGGRRAQRAEADADADADDGQDAPTTTDAAPPTTEGGS